MHSKESCLVETCCRCSGRGLAVTVAYQQGVRLVWRVRNLGAFSSNGGQKTEKVKDRVELFAARFSKSVIKRSIRSLMSLEPPVQTSGDPRCLGGSDCGVLPCFVWRSRWLFRAALAKAGPVLGVPQCLCACQHCRLQTREY